MQHADTIRLDHDVGLAPAGTRHDRSPLRETQDSTTHPAIEMLRTVASIAVIVLVLPLMLLLAGLPIVLAIRALLEAALWVLGVL